MMSAALAIAAAAVPAGTLIGILIGRFARTTA
jgi:hypothetical protein